MEVKNDPRCHHDCDSIHDKAASKQEWMILESKLKALESRCNHDRSNGAKTIFTDLRTLVATKSTLSDINANESSEGNEVEEGKNLRNRSGTSTRGANRNSGSKRGKSKTYKTDEEKQKDFEGRFGYKNEYADYECSLYDDDTLSTVGLSGSDSSLSFDYLFTIAENEDEDLKCLRSYQNNKRNIGMEELMQREKEKKKKKKSEVKKQRVSARNYNDICKPSSGDIRDFEVIRDFVDDAGSSFAAASSTLTDDTMVIDNRHKQAKQSVSGKKKRSSNLQPLSSVSPRKHSNKSVGNQKKKTKVTSTGNQQQQNQQKLTSIITTEGKEKKVVSFSKPLVTAVLTRSTHQSEDLSQLYYISNSSTTLRGCTKLPSERYEQVAEVGCAVDRYSCDHYNSSYCFPFNNGTENIADNPSPTSSSNRLPQQRSWLLSMKNVKWMTTALVGSKLFGTGNSSSQVQQPPRRIVFRKTPAVTQDTVDDDDDDAISALTTGNSIASFKFLRKRQLKAFSNYKIQKKFVKSVVMAFLKSTLRFRKDGKNHVSESSTTPSSAPLSKPTNFEGESRNIANSNAERTEAVRLLLGAYGKEDEERSVFSC